MGEWLENNREPPINYANQQNPTYRMNRSRGGKLNAGRYDKQKNQVLYYYRLSIFNNMINNVDIDLSGEPDLDAICVQDYKFCPGAPLDFLEDRFGLAFWSAQVTVDLDEIVSIRFVNEQGQDQTQWVLTQKCKLYPQGILSKQYKFTEMQRINTLLVKKAQKEAEEKAAVEQIERPVY